METMNQPNETRIEERVLTVLRDRFGQFVDLPFLVATSKTFSVHSRISDLRKRGYIIQNKIVSDGRTRHSFYRLSGKVDNAHGQLTFAGAVNEVNHGNA